jgi:hypothetical protein
MLEASVRSVEPAGTELRTLDSASTAALLEAVVALNVAGEEEAALLSSPEIATSTLRICRELGWTPGQVWATPAPEVDRLLRLMEAARGAAPSRADAGRGPSPLPPPMGSGIASHPDAIIIQIEDDAP